jgi:hypothetical protein
MRRAGVIPFFRRAASAVFLLLSATVATAATDADGVIRQALGLAFQTRYPEAEALLEGLPPGAPARPYYAGVVCLNRFLDWGDTTALRRAEEYWEKIPPQGHPHEAFRRADPGELALYRGLAGIQLSYVASLKGQRLRPATLAFAARRHLLERPEPEAKASLMLFEYYRSQLLGKLPFVEDREFPVKDFRRLAEDSPLRGLFLTSLFWIHLERGQLEPAMEIASGLSARAPGNRLVREMRGDAYFRSRRFAEARQEYEALLREYDQVRDGPDRIPLGYFRVVGNLARIYNALGMHREAAAKRAEWNRAGLPGVGPWLPPRLKRDLEAMTRAAE